MIIPVAGGGMRTAALAAPLLAVVAACAPADAESAAAAAAARFAQALASQDGASACALLTEAARRSLETGSGQSCEEAVLDVSSDTASVRVQVWGDEAQARAGRDTLFLDRTSNGWRVRAAGCTPQGKDQPYECEVAP